jgi:predicted glycosyltransferase
MLLGGAVGVEKVQTTTQSTAAAVSTKPDTTSIVVVTGPFIVPRMFSKLYATHGGKASTKSATEYPA